MVDVVNFNIDKSAFTIRQPRMKLWHLAIIGITIGLTIFLSVIYGSEVLRNITILVVTTCIVGLIYMVQNRNFDERTATEFQALIFSGAMRATTLLTLVIYRDGSIFYLDPRYPLNFAKGMQKHNLDQFLTTIGLEAQDKIQVYDAIKDLTKTEFEYTYNDAKRTVPLKIGVYPIQRPDGFVALYLMENYK